MMRGGEKVLLWRDGVVVLGRGVVMKRRTEEDDEEMSGYIREGRKMVKVEGGDVERIGEDGVVQVVGFQCVVRPHLLWRSDCRAKSVMEKGGKIVEGVGKEVMGR